MKDLDFERHQIVVRQGKGRQDRRTLLPVAVRERLQAHLGEVKRQHDDDLAHGVGRVVLPFALDRKYPNAATDWAWQFVFPAARICRDPQFGPPSRYHLHELVVQKAVADAARAATGRAHDDDLPARPQPWGAGRPQPRRPVVRVSGWRSPARHARIHTAGACCCCG